MSSPYCEKDCQSCDRFLSARCPGCTEGPGKALTSDCSIATCARLKGIKFCSGCSSRNNCRHYADRHAMPRLREEKTQAEEKKRRFALRNASCLAGYYWALALLIFLPNVAIAVLNAMELSNVSAWVSAVSCVLVGPILIKMGKSDLSYNTAGILVLSRAVLCILSILLIKASIFNSEFSSFLVSISTFVSIFQSYYMIRGHVDTFHFINRKMSDKWDTLWHTLKWTLITLVVSSILLSVLHSTIFSFLLIICVIFFVIISFMEFVYLCKTAIIATRCKKQLETELS